MRFFLPNLSGAETFSTQRHKPALNVIRLIIRAKDREYNYIICIRGRKCCAEKGGKPLLIRNELCFRRFFVEYTAFKNRSQLFIKGGYTDVRFTGVQVPVLRRSNSF